MADNGGSYESEFNSVTSSQRSLLKHCPFADSASRPAKSPVGTDSYSTEILGNQISPLARTPVLSFSSPKSLDSINDDDVFRTPPENASLSSSAADSETRVRVSKLKSPSSESETTPVTPSPPVRVSQTTPLLNPVTEEVIVKPLSPPPSVRVLGKRTASDSPSPTSDPLGDTGVPISSSRARVSCSDGDIPFKEIIEALLRNSGVDLNERDEKVSYVDILKQCGLKFPK